METEIDTIVSSFIIMLCNKCETNNERIDNMRKAIQKLKSTINIISEPILVCVHCGQQHKDNKRSCHVNHE